MTSVISTIILHPEFNRIYCTAYIFVHFDMAISDGKLSHFTIALQSCEMGIITPILPMKKLRFRGPNSESELLTGSQT